MGEIKEMFKEITNKLKDIEDKLKENTNEIKLLHQENDEMRTIISAQEV